MLARFSHSALGTFRSCPQKFKFEKVDKVTVPRRFYAHTHLGNTVHKQLKIAYQLAADGKLYSLEDMLAGFDSDWSGSAGRKVIVANENLTVDDVIESGRRMLTTYYNRYQPFDQGTLKLAERMLNFILPNCPSGFRAKLDRLWEREDGVVEICDYKTGASMAAGARDRSFRLQMGMYHLAVQALFPQFTEIEVAQYFLRQDEVIRDRIGPDELDELAEQFRSEVQDIWYAFRIDDWPTKEGSLCRFCDFAHLCPAKRHRTALEAEETDEGFTVAEHAAELADKFILVDVEKKKLEAEHRALKEDLVNAAGDLGVNKLYGSKGHVSVRVKPVEKLPTKSGDLDRFAAVSALVRSWEIETCLKLDDTAVLELYRKGRLTEDQTRQIREFIQPDERVTVTAKPKQSEDPDVADEN